MYSWKITTEEYIHRAKAVHGDKYSYELTEYVDRNTFITVTCPIHGPFKVHPYTHVRLGTGCSKCAQDKTIKTCSLTTESFIKRAKEYMVHPTFRVIDSVQKKKTAEQIVYLNNDKQMYNHEQQFSISCVGSL